ncbi:MAG: acetylornithine/succinylornithine family transaminase [Gammaproteobacteria bacterium]|nr:acetylornithine/succinylornithine family transaminase [Gammaproteobacteria bacterium]
MADFMKLEQQFAFEVYPKRELVLTRGEGAAVWDDRGNEYIDCTAGIGVASVGHANPAVAEAIEKQARVLVTCPGIFYNDVRAALMAKLAEITPPNLNRVFLCNSGTEATEAAIKFARWSTGRQKIVSLMRGFHGRTLGALSATFKYRDEFEPLIPGHGFVPLNDVEKLDQALDEDTACLILELVQGEGGVRPAQIEYVRRARELCTERGVLLVIDEIQTGFGRCGAMFACELYGVQPDMMTLAKALGGGVPIGAVMCSDTIRSAAGKHGSTFGGNPLACAAAIAAVRYIEEHDLAGSARENGAYFRELIERSQSSVIREVRQSGLMIGIELKQRVKPYLIELMAEGVLALPAGPTVIRLLPPLTIPRDRIECVAAALGRVLGER